MNVQNNNPVKLHKKASSCNKYYGVRVFLPAKIWREDGIFCSKIADRLVNLYVPIYLTTAEN